MKKERPFSKKKKNHFGGNKKRKNSRKRKKEIPSDAVECKCRLNRPRQERNKLQRQRRRMRRKELRQLRQRRRELRREKLSSCKKESENDKDGRSNCFSHDDQHWRTPPFWNDGKFCACTNSNTNRYWCVRTVNLTHNYLYCEFVTGAITYYDLNVDPYQLRNIYQTLSNGELNYMHQQLGTLKSYSGFDEYENGAKMRREDEKDFRRKRKEIAAKRKKNVSEFRSQKSFIKRYGQYLPPLEAYHNRRRKKFYFTWKTRVLVRKNMLLLV